MSDQKVEVEHSTDGGRTWKVIQVHPGSVAANVRHPWHDGYGNTYRPKGSDR